MANVKITELPALTAPVAADLVEVVDDVAVTPTSKKVTVGDLLATEHDDDSDMGGNYILDAQNFADLQAKGPGYWFDGGG